ncbi:unnamed protein product [Vicia faba]|uniref:Arginase n=1 Tax=Vicia faba TaxID=3906 RepID=A0AAV1A3K6_VICFA|nr:unnamed protein product [Vicia faba]
MLSFSSAQGYLQFQVEVTNSILRCLHFHRGCLHSSLFSTSALDAECACIDTNLCICMFFLNLGDFLVQKLGEGVKGVYISIDVDCLDPAFAPGVSHIEPGGLSFRDVLNILHNLQGDVVAGDVVELNPQRDTVDGMTAMVAAKLVREMAAKIAK